MNLLRPALAVALSLLTSSTFAQTIESCDTSFAYDSPPARAITLNQQATEVMLALGLEDRMIGTAYLDDTIPDQWLEAYNSVPVALGPLSGQGSGVGRNPDFLFAGFASAFNDTNLGAEAEWHGIGIGPMWSMPNAAISTPPIYA